MTPAMALQVLTGVRSLPGAQKVALTEQDCRSIEQMLDQGDAHVKARFCLDQVAVVHSWHGADYLCIVQEANPG